MVITRSVGVYMNNFYVVAFMLHIELIHSFRCSSNETERTGPTKITSSETTRPNRIECRVVDENIYLTSTRIR